MPLRPLHLWSDDYCHDERVWPKLPRTILCPYIYQWKHVICSSFFSFLLQWCCKPTSEKSSTVFHNKHCATMLPHYKNYWYSTWLSLQQVEILGLLNRVRTYFTLVEQTKITSFREFSGNRLGEEGPRKVFICKMNDNVENMNEVICDRKSFKKNPRPHGFCIEILFLVF